MNKIFKYFLWVIFLFVTCPIFAVQNNGIDVHAIKGQLMDGLKDTIKTPSLYSLVRQELESYYDLKDFSDPNHETGWYRVDNFLKWVKDNEKVLEKETINISHYLIPFKDLYNGEDFSKPENYYPFWGYLGMRYIANVYGINTNFDEITFSFVCHIHSAKSMGIKTISLCISRKEVVPTIINIGIHETSHLLPFDSWEARTELLTFYSTYNYGLPVKAKDAISFSEGVRDIRRTIELRPDLDILLEYNYYMAGLVLNSKISIQDLYLLKQKDNFFIASIGEICFNLIAMKRNKFFDSSSPYISGGGQLKELNETEIFRLKENPNKEIYLGRKDDRAFGRKHVFAKWINGSTDYEKFLVEHPMEMQEYLDKMFGKYSTSEIEYLYNGIYEKLPKQFIKEINKNFKEQTGNTFWEMKGYDIVKKYDVQIREAILQTLEEMNIPEAKIPEGYI